MKGLHVSADSIWQKARKYIWYYCFAGGVLQSAAGKHLHAAVLHVSGGRKTGHCIP